MVFKNMSNGKIIYRTKTKQSFSTFLRSLLHELTENARKRNISTQDFFDNLAPNLSQKLKTNSFDSPEVVLTFEMENGKFETIIIRQLRLTPVLN